MPEMYIENFELATKELVADIRHAFHERVASSNPDFYPEDLARVKTDDLWMKRFLAAEEYDVKKATQMLYETCQWRKEFGTNELDHTQLKSEVLENGVLFIRNTDKWGKKLLIFKAKLHSKGVYPMEDVKKFIVYFFERIEREAKSEQISIIFDMKDTGWNNMDMDFIRYLITLLKQYYPYFVNFLMIYEMPWLLKSAWNIIKGWLPAKFVDRVKFLDKKTIGDFITPENQLVDWGGTDDYKYKWIPEVRGGEMKKQKQKLKELNGTFDTSASVSPLTSPSPSPTMMTPIPNGKSPPEVRPRKVKLSGADGGADQTRINLTSIDSERPPSQSQSLRLSSAPVPYPPPGGPLAEVDEVITFTGSASGISANFHVQNLRTQTIIIKVKTTAPERYRVRPTIGLIEGEARAVVNVYVHDGVPAWTLTHDRFQVQVALVPPGFQIDNLDTDSGGGGSGSHGNINHGDLNSKWKSIAEAEGAVLETHRLTCRVDSNLSASNGSSLPPAGTVTMSEDDMRRGLSQLEQKMAASLSAKMDERFKYIEYLLYGLFGLVLLVGIILYFSMPGKVHLPENICTMPEHNQIFAGMMGGDHGHGQRSSIDSCVEH